MAEKKELTPEKKKQMIILGFFLVILFGVVFIVKNASSKEQMPELTPEPVVTSTYDITVRNRLKSEPRRVSDYTLDDNTLSPVAETQVAETTPVVTAEITPASYPVQQKTFVVASAVATPKQQMSNTSAAPSTEGVSSSSTRRTGFVDKTVASPVPSATTAINIPTVVHSESIVQSGDQITLRTTSDCTINGVIMPANTFLTGDLTGNQNRLMIFIAYAGVELSAWDMDGEGIRIEGGLKGEINNSLSNEAIDAATSTVSDVVNIPIVGRAISVVKNIASNKTNTNRITIPKGYKLFLKLK